VRTAVAATMVTANIPRRLARRPPALGESRRWPRHVMRLSGSCARIGRAPSAR
jgi:hypothetical protein